MSIGARVATCRAGSGTATAFLSFELGNVANDEFTPVLKINDVVLRQRDDGEYWLAFPSKQRMRDGKPVLNDAGRPVYDDFVVPAFEPNPSGSGWKVSKAGERFKAYLLKLAVEAFDALSKEASGRGGASRQAPAPAARRAPAAAGAGAGTARRRVAEPTEPNLGFGSADDDDDGLPF